jgi:hypothetical protein
MWQKRIGDGNFTFDFGGSPFSDKAIRVNFLGRVEFNWFNWTRAPEELW